MKSRDSRLKTCRRSRRAFAIAAVVASCGCTHLATVKTTPARAPTVVSSESELTLAKQHLAAAERAQPLVALGDDLSAAQLSLQILDKQPNDSSARSIYNFSVARAVENVERANIRPWQRNVSVTVDQTVYLLSTPKPVDPEHDPNRYDLIPVDALKIGGTLFNTRAPVNGIGAPLVAVARTENPWFRQQYKFSRIYASVTAVIRFSGQKAELEFVDPMKADRVALSNRTFPLAVDLTTPTAMLIVRERPERLGFSRVIDPEKYAETTRLCQLQQYDPGRTPVIFVHGLQETGASWTPMIHSLRDDPWIRKRYQFWFYSYPSGYPYPYSAALFRHDLDGIARAIPNHKRIVLIGHSMGGMICRLMITDSGDKIWRS